MMNRGGLSGYTLVELLIVMAVIAMVAGLGVPFFARSLERAELKSAAGEMAALMRLARQEAIARKTVFSAVIDPAQKAAYAIEGRFDAGNPAGPFNGEAVKIPDAVKVWTPRDGLLVLEFSPAGTASACNLAVTSMKADSAEDENGYRVTLDPLSGRARVIRNEAAGIVRERK
ncbi:MAG: prepilin-type N-terminal cleavage/methylation domain-containing protein [Nitrospinae bacterium]|nr:prepilin-type N-terminal cleavage/methylation domain-containing protein [Nitrospinota bacterium]